MSEHEFPPARDGVEQRLDAVLAELRSLRVAMAPVPLEPIVGEGIAELREPARPPRRRG